MVKFKVGDIVTFREEHPKAWEQDFPSWPAMEVVRVVDYRNGGRLCGQSLFFADSASSLGRGNARLVMGGPW